MIGLVIIQYLPLIYPALAKEEQDTQAQTNTGEEDECFILKVLDWSQKI